MNDINKPIMQALRQNARTSLRKLAGELDMPTSTVHDRVRRMEEKVIDKHVALLRFKALGYPVRKQILLSTENKHATKAFIHAVSNINTAFQLEGSYDFLLDCVFRSEADSLRFEDDLQSISRGTILPLTIKNSLKLERFMSE